MASADHISPPFRRVIDLNVPGAEAFVVIDSHLGGGGTGGIRMGESVTLEEVADLAHEMTLKFAWLNIPRGGAKAGIACKNDITEAERKQLHEKLRQGFLLRQESINVLLIHRQ